MKTANLITLPHLIIFLSALMDIVSLILIKKFINSNDIETSSLLYLNFYRKALTDPLFLVGLILFILSPILFFISLTYLNLSVSYPLNISFKVIISFILAVLILKEEIKIKNILGIMLLIFSIILIN